MSFAALKVFALIATVLQVPVLARAVAIKNIPIACLTTWFLILNFNVFISLQIWGADDFINRWNGDIFCDVMARFLAGSNAGVISATIAASRNLALLMANDGPRLDFNSFKCRLIDLIICLAPPVIMMLEVFIVQERRYYVVKYQGCTLAVYPSWVTFGLLLIWPSILAVIAFPYVAITVYRYFVKQVNANDALHCANTGITQNRFRRMFAFCVVVVLVMFPLSIRQVVSDVIGLQLTAQPFNWDVVHSQTWAGVLWGSSTGPKVDGYVDVVLAFINFIAFGTGQEMSKWYMELCDKIGFGVCLRRIGACVSGLWASFALWWNTPPSTLTYKPRNPGISKPKRFWNARSRSISGPMELTISSPLELSSPMSSKQLISHTDTVQTPSPCELKGSYVYHQGSISSATNEYTDNWV